MTGETQDEVIQPQNEEGQQESPEDSQPQAMEGASQEESQDQPADEGIQPTQAAEQDDEDNRAPEWVRDLRKAHRRAAKENRELRARIEAMESQSSQAIQDQTTPNRKPKLEDFDYDADQYEVALDTWYQQKSQADVETQRQQAEQQRQAQAWQGQMNRYQAEKAKLNMPDYQEAENFVVDTLNNTQQGIIVQYANNPALVIAILGKNPSKAYELSEISDPIEFALKLQTIEKEGNKMARRPPPPPEKTISNSGPKSGVVDNTLAKLRNEAEQSGNWSKVVQYKRQKREASR